MKRRVALLLGVSAVLVLGVAAVALAANLVGTLQADIQNGTPNNDHIYGLNGGDTQRGNAGNDYIEGGLGADTQHGDAGNDQVWGGPGGDDSFGDAGNDFVNGGFGPDNLFGGTGDDYLDSVDRISGNDSLLAGDEGGDFDVCIVDDDPNNGEDDHSGCEDTYHVETP
jgi:Ca2+-binding RTX toxin-like protein